MKSTRRIIFCVIGIFCLFVSIRIMNMSTGIIGDMAEYGGDAYTGIQNTEVITGANVHYLSEIITKCFAYSFLVGGLLLIVNSIFVNKKQTN